MREYFLSLICAALLCAVAGNMVEKKGTYGMVLKLICGVFLAFTVVRPVVTIRLEEMSFFTMDISQEAEYAANMGTAMAESQLASIIKQETEAYILDKANGMGLQISADVSLDEKMLPQIVVLSGNISLEEKEIVSQIIETDLGIAEENQIWNVS